VCVCVYSYPFLCSRSHRQPSVASQVPRSYVENAVRYIHATLTRVKETAQPQVYQELYSRVFRHLADRMTVRLPCTLDRSSSR
jgi:hypothetical protein